MIRASGVAGLRELVAERGADAGALLRRVGIRAADAGDHEVFISYRSLVEAVEGGAALTGLPDFGLRLAARQGVDILGPLAVAARTASSMGEALGICGVYLTAYSPAIAVRMMPLDEPGHTLLEFEIVAPDIPPAPQTVELSLGIAVAMCRYLAGSGYRPVAVALPHGPLSPRERYEEFFGCPPRFGQVHSGLVLRDSDLTRTVSHDAKAHAVILRYLDSVVGPEESGLAAPVRRLVRDLMPSGAMTMDLVARQFALHPKSLQRRLAEEGTSFAAIVEETRRQLAVHYLRDTDLSLGVVARELGYAEQSVLSRSCVRWFGRSPSRVRATLRAGAPAPA